VQLHAKQTPETPVRQAAESFLSLPVGTDRTSLRRPVNAIFRQRTGQFLPRTRDLGAQRARAGLWITADRSGDRRSSRRTRRAGRGVRCRVRSLTRTCREAPARSPFGVPGPTRVSSDPGCAARSPLPCRPRSPTARGSTTT